MASLNNQAALSRLNGGMPLLDHLERGLRAKRQLGRLLQIHGPPTKRGLQIADGYVRLVEKATLEYAESRKQLVLFLDEGLVDALFRAEDHFESCVNSTHRAISYLDGLRSLGFRNADGSPFVPRPRDFDVLSDSTKRQIRDLRDAMEHLDKDIVKGVLPEDANVAVKLGLESAALAGFELHYRDLASWLEALHRFAVPLSRVELIVSTPSPSFSIPGA